MVFFDFETIAGFDLVAFGGMVKESVRVPCALERALLPVFSSLQKFKTIGNDPFWL